MYMSLAGCKLFLDIVGILDLSFDNNPNIQHQYCQSWVKISTASFMAATLLVLLDERLRRWNQPEEPMVVGERFYTKDKNNLGKY